MTDEEKKAIKIVKGITEDDLLNYWEGPEEPYNAIQTILNLIEKQFKEIEELKQEKEYLNCIIESDKDNYINKDQIKAKIEEKFLEAKGLYERGVQPQAQYTMKLLRDLEKSLLEKE